MIDCHAHLAISDFDADRVEVLDRARAAGVQRVLVVGEDEADDRRVLEICGQHPMLAACIGFHPDRFGDEAPMPSEDAIEGVCDLAHERRTDLVAIGEVGLDYWYAKDDTRRAAQRRCLERMVALAVDLDLPLNVHSRSAGHHTLELLASAGAKRVLMHAFDGRASYAVKAAEQHGFLFSIPPSVVRSPQKQKLVKRLPLESLALETDSPVLGPERGQRNEPANITHSLRCIASLKKVDEDRVREATTANAQRLFALEKGRP